MLQQVIVFQKFLSKRLYIGPITNYSCKGNTFSRLIHRHSIQDNNFGPNLIILSSNQIIPTYISLDRINVKTSARVFLGAGVSITYTYINKQVDRECFRAGRRQEGQKSTWECIKLRIINWSVVIIAVKHGHKGLPGSILKRNNFTLLFL